MTMIVSLLHRKFVLQVADRRLVYPDGSIAEDNETKLIVVNGHMTFAFTGLARLPVASGDRARTDIWFTDIMAKLTVNSFDERMSKLADKSAEVVRRIPMSAQLKRLAFSGAGWVRQRGNEELVPIRCLVSNFHSPEGNVLAAAQDSFNVIWFGIGPRTPARWFTDGQYASTDDSLAIERTLRRLGTDRITGQIALELACRTIRRVAASNRSVGKNLLSVYLPAEAVKPGFAFISSGRPSGASTKCLYLPDGDSVGEHRTPHVVAFGTQMVDSRFGPASRDGLVRVPPAQSHH